MQLSLHMRTQLCPYTPRDSPGVTQTFCVVFIGRVSLFMTPVAQNTVKYTLLCSDHCIYIYMCVCVCV